MYVKKKKAVGNLERKNPEGGLDRLTPPPPGYVPAITLSSWLLLSSSGRADSPCRSRVTGLARPPGSVARLTGAASHGRGGSGQGVVPGRFQRLTRRLSTPGTTSWRHRKWPKVLGATKTKQLSELPVMPVKWFTALRFFHNSSA